MFVITEHQCPHLEGLSYNIATAEIDGIIWNDRGYMFSPNLPSYLIGTTLFQIPHKAIPMGTTTEIFLCNPSTIYIANEAHDRNAGRDGGFDESLPGNGWTLVDDSAEVRTDLFYKIGRRK